MRGGEEDRGALARANTFGHAVKNFVHAGIAFDRAGGRWTRVGLTLARPQSSEHFRSRRYHFRSRGRALDPSRPHLGPPAIERRHPRLQQRTQHHPCADSLGQIVSK
eukprot:3296124-Pyramimonas_sp.AAC.2